jgi:hypothetical protein
MNRLREAALATASASVRIFFIRASGTYPSPLSGIGWLGLKRTLSHRMSHRTRTQYG